MASYKRLVLLNILNDLYPGIPISCGTTYNTIKLHGTSKPIVPEQTISSSYPTYMQKYNLSIMRKIRAQRLSASDKYGLADYPFPDDASRQAWLTYRQALRNITTVYSNPDTDINDNLLGVVWPKPPSSISSNGVIGVSVSATDASAIDASASAIDASVSTININSNGASS